MSRPERARLRKLHPDALDSEQQVVYEAVTGGPRSSGPALFRLVDEQGALEGPFNAMLLAPRLGHSLQALGSAVRYQTSLTDRAREIAILVVAAYRASSFEWYAHEAVGRHVGLTDAELHGIECGDHESLAGPERVVADTTRALLHQRDLDDLAYASIVDVLGEAGLFELLTLVGYYDTLALLLQVFRVPAPAEDP